MLEFCGKASIVELILCWPRDSGVLPLSIDVIDFFSFQSGKPFKHPLISSFPVIRASIKNTLCTPLEFYFASNNSHRQLRGADLSAMYRNYN